MVGSVVKNSLCNGYPGVPSHTPDLIISNHIVSSYEPEGIAPGDLCAILGDGTVVKFTNDYIEQEKSFGIAARVIATPNTYRQNEEKFFPGDVIGIVVRGAVTVPVNQGCINKNQEVIMEQMYVRVAGNDAEPNGVIGSLETKPKTAAEAGSNDVKKLAGMVLSSLIDENGIAEITILERNMI